MTGPDRDRIAAANAALKNALLRHMPKPDVRSTAIDGLTLVRREAANSSERCFSQPLASIIVQGGKHIVIGDQEYHIRENQCLVSGVDAPSSSYAVNPTPEHPFLSLFIRLDARILSDLVMDMKPEGAPAGHAPRGVCVADADPEFMEGMARLLALLDKPGHIPMRAPMIMRELHYLLLVGPQGNILRQLYAKGSHGNQVARAIALLRKNIAAPLRMDDLARETNMSASNLYRHFKSVTGFSPLQYHKQLRLYEAQRLMLAENERAANAALAVGYESVTQFNREYKRMFGEPPRRDMNRRRGAA